MNRFKELRLSKGLTQESFRSEFNKRFNRSYTAAAISQFENGKRIPEISALIDFADFYGVSIDYFIGRDDKKPVSVLSDEQTKVLGFFEKLGELGKQELFRYLDYLKYRYSTKTTTAV